MSNGRPILVSTLAAFAVAMAGGLATRVGSWYEGLEKPSFNPPNWLFAPAWTFIYVLCVAAAVLAWRSSHANTQRVGIMVLFFFNAVVNILWSVLFFTLQRPDWALAEVGVLWISIAALIVFFSRFAKTSALLLVPYLLWVSFAAFLNYKIVALNGPFA
ncbi:MAG: TspO/MBR family protein [Pseudomonadota bacterium]